MKDGIGGSDGAGQFTITMSQVATDEMMAAEELFARERVMAWHAQLPRAVQLRILPDDLEKLIAMLKG